MTIAEQPRLPTAVPPEPVPKARRRKDSRAHNRPLIPIELDLTGFANGGRAVGHAEDGRVVFVEYGIPGERVIAEITNDAPGYIEATAVLVLRSSEHRVDAPCGYFGRCGGCQLQHIDYPEQLRLKTGVVREQLARIGNFDASALETTVLEMLGMNDPWHYRNHMRYTVRRDGQVGFMQRGTHRFLRVDQCEIASEQANALLARIQDRTMQTAQVSIRVAEQADDYLIQPHLEWRPRTRGSRPSSGQRTYHEVLGERDYRISAAAFFQVNTRQAELLVRLVVERVLEAQPNVVVDAYAGVGTFAAQLAPEVGEVITIESSVAADGDASINLQDFENVERLVGSVESLLPGLQPSPDVVIIDPPRSGLEGSTIKAMIASRARRVVYVSCDPATLARDLRLFVDGGFELIDVQPVDMFPHTQHIECVTVLDRTVAGG
ncbi:MAG: class I SAM-dependent RNA methyltransferase [Chloroflexi bacterium]|nr:class I SAM-dependent RNA methyltransferase [Chloroflexota bacterium]MDA1145191.1 class I SAM-dependent RNA methyltransferase [Chloroflexota bacterium]